MAPTVRPRAQVRQIIIETPPQGAEHVIALAQRHHATNIARIAALDGAGRAATLVLLHASNAATGSLLEELDRVTDVRVSLLPVGALPLRPPRDEVADQVTDVTPRSPFEIYIAGLQSVGSWQGFIAYGVISAAVVWLGFITDTIYLLIGAMLIAPFAGPAVNTAIATARGDAHLLRRSVLRYAAAIAVTGVTVALLTLAFGPAELTETMVSVSRVSAVSLLLPLAAGVAGAVHLTQGDQNSLVSGAASGMLIAASLAPAAALVGIAAASGHLGILQPALFLLALQLVGINVAGALTFRAFGLQPTGMRAPEGSGRSRMLSLGATALALAGLLWWQFGSASPALTRATAQREMRDAVSAAIRSDPTVGLVETTIRFTRRGTPGPHPAVAEVRVQRLPGAAGSDDELRRRTAALVRAAIGRAAPNVSPAVFVDLAVP